MSCAGVGDLSVSLGATGSVDCRSIGAIDFTGGFGLPRSFCNAVFTSGFFFKSIFGFDGCVDSFDTWAIAVAFGFGVSARCAEAVEAGVNGGVAIGAPSGLTICEATDGAAAFGASARGAAESGEAGVGGAFAIGSPSGRIACEAADGAAAFGASARGGAELGEAGVGGAFATGSPSGRIAGEAADGAAAFGASARGGAGIGRRGSGRRFCNWLAVRPDRLRGCCRGRRLWRLTQKR